MAFFYLQTGAAHVVSYTCNGQALYFIKVKTNTLAATLQTKFVSADKAQETAERITKSKRLNLQNWEQFQKVPADFMQSKELTQRIFDLLWHRNEGLIKF